MISVDEINPDFEQEVEFLNLSNLALSCPRSKAYIDGLKKPGLEPIDEVDKCNVLSPPTGKEIPNTCEEHPDCFRHFEKGMFLCSSKSRRFEFADVSVFRHKHIIREVQKYRQMWCIEIDSVSMDLYFISPSGKQIPVIMYCRVIQSLQTGIVYVVFSSGVVLSGPDVVPKLRDYSLQIIQQIKELVEPGTKICLCGHSMGATVSMAVAYHWFYEDTNYFMSHVNVVALGSINLFEHETMFTNLPNIRSYLSASSTPHGIFVDPFCMRGDSSKTIYSPVKLILSEVVDVDVNDIKVTKNSATVTSRDVTFEVSQHQQYNELHGLDRVYIPTLLQLCKKRVYSMGGLFSKNSLDAKKFKDIKPKKIGKTRTYRKKGRYTRKLIR
jgi:hypothetical protein